VLGYKKGSTKRALNDHDILVDGSTSADSSPQTLCRIREEWTGPTRPLTDQQLADVQAMFKSLASVIPDSQGPQSQGGAGQDLFLS
jgi:hypothetical protein